MKSNLAKTVGLTVTGLLLSYGLTAQKIESVPDTVIVNGVDTVIVQKLPYEPTRIMKPIPNHDGSKPKLTPIPNYVPGTRKIVLYNEEKKVK